MSHLHLYIKLFCVVEKGDEVFLSPLVTIIPATLKLKNYFFLGFLLTRVRAIIFLHNHHLMSFFGGSELGNKIN